MSVSTSIFDAALSTLAQIKAWMGGDSLLNSEPVHDVDRDIDADNWNKIVSGLSEIAQRTRKGNLCCMHWRLGSLSASATAQLERPDSGGLEYIVAPWGGSLVALAVTMGSAVNAGTLTVRASQDTTDMDLEVAFAGAGSEGAERQLPGVDTFAADAKLRIEAETDGSFACAGSTEISVDAWFSFGEEEDV